MGKHGRQGSGAGGSGGGTGAPKLAALLEAMTDAELTALFDARPDLALPAPSSFAQLADRASSWSSVRNCLAALDWGCRQVAEALQVVSAPTTRVDLARALGVGTDPLERPLKRLSSLALVSLHGEAVRAVPGLTASARPGAGGGYPARLGPAWASLATQIPASGLAAFARKAGLGLPSGATRAAITAALTRALSEPDRVAALVASGPPGTAELAHRLAFDYPEAVVTPSVSAATPVSPVGWLLDYGLVVGLGWNRVVMPAEVGLALRGGRLFTNLELEAPVLETVAADAEAVDHRGAEVAAALVADIAAVLDDWGANPPKLLKAGGLGVREVRRAAKLVGRDERATARMIELATVGGLAAADWRAGLALPTPAYDDWSELDTASRWAGLVSAWIAAPVHVSLAGAIGEDGKPFACLLPRLQEAQAVERRSAVLDVMASVPAGRAAAEASLLLRIVWEAPDRWQGGPAEGGFARWVIDEAEMLGVTAGGALTGAGRSAWEGKFEEAGRQLAMVLPPVISEVVLQADLTAVVAGQPEPSLAAALELMADVESGGAACVYRFSEASLRRAFEAGRTAPEINDLLSRHARHGVPQTLSYLIDDLGRRFGRVRVGHVASYVRSDDAALLAEVVRARKLARVGLRLLAPTVAVSSQGPDVVLGALQAAGYLPAHEGASGDLLIARPALRRAALRPAIHTGPTRHPGATLAAAAVASLRGRKAPAKAPLPPPAPSLPGPAPELGAGGFRPAQIVHDPATVEELMRWAAVEDWGVRVSYVGPHGGTELDIAPFLVEGGTVLATNLPEMSVVELHTDRIAWARTMTEAEEEALFQ